MLPAAASVGPPTPAPGPGGPAPGGRAAGCPASTPPAPACVGHTTLALGPEWLSPDALVSAGLLVLLLVVFVESGLLIGFFLPGDSLLFTAGLLISPPE